MKHIGLLVLICAAYGCSPVLSIWSVSETGVKKWSDQKIGSVISAHLTMHPDSVLKGKLDILRNEMVARNPDWDEEIKKAVLEGRIGFGMTSDQVYASWGAPHDINRTVLPNLVKEQWVYTKEVSVGGYSSGASYDKPIAYVYFENGSLTSWQD